MFDAISFCEENNIEYSVEGSKNVSAGWIGITCPFCGDTSNHLGIEISTGKCFCWKCGGKSLWKVIKELVPGYDIQKTISHYSWYTEKEKKLQNKHNFEEIEIPGKKPLIKPYKEYLLRRGFDPDYLAEKYDLRFGEPYSKYEYRLIIPVKYHNKNVSYQTRRIFDNQTIRYKNCKIEDAVIQNKNLCYNLDNCKKRFAVGVEGVTDVWRIGNDSFATFGTSFTIEQILMIKNHFDTVYWLYDPGQESQEKAQNAVLTLSPYINTEIIKIDGINDPGSMSEDDVIALRKELRLY